jgi:hypothetical protein
MLFMNLQWELGISCSSHMLFSSGKGRGRGGMNHASPVTRRWCCLWCYSWLRSWAAHGPICGVGRVGETAVLVLLVVVLLVAMVVRSSRLWGWRGLVNVHPHLVAFGIVGIVMMWGHVS